jgi:hypothetical protein
MQRFVFGLLMCLGLATPAVPAGQSVATRMKNVVFHIGDGVEVRVIDLAGHLQSTTNGAPVFDNISSYVLAVDAARVAMTPESLTNLMNHTSLPASTRRSRTSDRHRGRRATQSGTLKKGVPVPFSIKATVAATPDGRIRLHPTSIKAPASCPSASSISSGSTSRTW